jgi:transposase-like protein
MGTIAAELVETGEKRDARGRRVTPAEQRTQMVQAFHASGLTMAGFARREGIKYPTFAGWVVQAQRHGAPKSGIKFTEVRLPALAVPRESTPLEVRLPDGTVLRGGRPGELAELVRALRA